MNSPFIKRPALYGHPDDPAFETDSATRAEAYAKVFPLKPWLRKRLVDSGRFTSGAGPHLEGALQRDVELLMDYVLASPAEKMQIQDGKTVQHFAAQVQ